VGVRAVLVLVAVALAACKSPEPTYDGIGVWGVTRTVLRDATGRCQPTDLPGGRKGTWCFGQPALKLAGATAEVDLYFAGAEPTAKLIEEQLKVRGCREEGLLTKLRQLFGASTETKGPAVFWQNQFVFIAAIAPSEPGQCLVRVLPVSEKDEIAKIRAEPIK
jgi:hypothetical protein